MIPDPTDYEAELATGLHKLSQTRSACPAGNVLVQYQTGSLLGDARRAVERHVAVCGYCDSLLMRLNRFDASETESTPFAWDDSKGRIEQKLFPSTVAVPPSHRGMRWWNRASVAYAMAAICSGAFALVLLTTPHPVKNLAVWRGSHSIDLNRDRGSGALAVKEQMVVLSFFLATRTDAKYRASIDDVSSKWIIPDDENGNFRVPYLSSQLTPGHHRLLVTEINPKGTAEVKATFEFDISQPL